MTDPEVTPPLDEFLREYEQSPNVWWGMGCGHHLNLFEAAVERTSNDRYRLAWLSARRRASFAAKAFYAEASATRELEAAVVDMKPAPVTSRERVAEVVRVALSFEVGAAEGHLLTQQANRVTQALFAAGVFRDDRALEGTATQNRIIEALAAERDKHDRYQSVAWAFYDIAISIASRAGAGEPS